MNQTPPQTLQKLLFAIVLAISFFIIVTYLVSMGLGILVLFSTPEGLRFSQTQLYIYPLLIIDVPVLVNAGLYFLFLWWVFALCFAAAGKYRESLSNKIREFVSGTTKRSLFTNNLLAMPAITSMLLVTTLLLHYFQSTAGYPTGETTQIDPFLDFVRFSRAPLVEEIVFRIIPLGSFLVTYIYFAGIRLKPSFSWSQRMKACILSVLQPEKGKTLVGLKTISERGLFGGVIWAEWVIVGLTSSLFGVAHYLGGWGPGKISQAALSGAVFALAYLYYGVQAPILLHWYFNYYYSVFDLSFNYYSNQIDLLSLSWLANLFLGILMWAIMVILGSTVVIKRLRRKHPTTPVPEPPF